MKRIALRITRAVYSWILNRDTASQPAELRESIGRRESRGGQGDETPIAASKSNHQHTITASSITLLLDLTCQKANTAALETFNSIQFVYFSPQTSQNNAVNIMIKITSMEKKGIQN
jgi:hypothetical protein